MIKYLAIRDQAKITPVEVDRETEKSIWIERLDYSGNTESVRHLKLSTYSNYFNTFEEAKTFLIEEAVFKIRLLRGHIANKEMFLDTVIELTECLRND